MYTSMFFGNDNGEGINVSGSKNKKITLFGGNDLNAIQIGEYKHGGNSGKEQGSGFIPSDGVIKVYEIQAGNSKNITYIKLGLGNTIIEGGTKKDHFSLAVPDGLSAKLEVIDYDNKKILGLHFEIMED